MAAAVPNFALAPGLDDPNNVIDYADRNGKILWKQATDPLPIQYDGSTELMRPFQDAFKTRALDHGWDDPLTITIGQDAAGNNVDRSLLTHAGEVPLQAVRDNAINDYFQQQSRNAQRARQIHRCLQSSITSKVAKRLVPEAPKYYLDPNTPDGPCYYKVILDTYDIQTEATPHQIRLKIANVGDLIQELNYNIDTFNATVKGYQEDLASLGHTSSDMFAHVSKAYKTVPSKPFNTYITSKIDTHNDRTAVLTLDQLMDLAKAKYDEMNIEETWAMKDEQEEQIVALTAQLEQVQLSHEQLRKKLLSVKNQSRSSGSKHPKSNPPTNRPPKKSKPNDSKWKWKEEHPKPGVTTRVHDGKTYHWCRHHKKWCLHTESECRLKDRQPTTPTQGMAAVFEDGHDVFTNL